MTKEWSGICIIMSICGSARRVHISLPEVEDCIPGIKTAICGEASERGVKRRWLRLRLARLPRVAEGRGHLERAVRQRRTRRKRKSLTWPLTTGASEVPGTL
ncbi:hypothetical protein J6590_061842 [Homalodisca vitripennis]|nr:hypothetical protein J6590_061842 [Homalodisca vitripennis]